jgi:type II secretory pathway component PulK
VLLAVLWITVLLTAVAFEVSRRARLERLSALNVVDDVVLTAALDASVERARSWLSGRLAGGGVSRLTANNGGSQTDPWGDVDSYSSDTVRLSNVRFVTTVSDVGAKLNINQAGTSEIALFFSALGVEPSQLQQLAATFCNRRGEPAENCPSVSVGEERISLRRPVPSTGHAFKSVDDVADAIEMAPELWQRVEPLLTVFGSGRVNLRTATGPVLMTLPGFSAEVVDAVGEVRGAGGRLNSLDDLLPRLSFHARGALLVARPMLEQRILFETLEVEVRSRAWTAGGLYGESVAAVRRDDRQLSAFVVRLQ